MDLVSLLVLVLVFGLLYYLITLLPLPAPFKNVALIILISDCNSDFARLGRVRSTEEIK